MDLASRKERLEKKRFHLQELLTQQISFKNLVQRNGAPKAEPGDRIPLPFIIVNTHKETVRIECSSSSGSSGGSSSGSSGSSTSRR